MRKYSLLYIAFASVILLWVINFMAISFSLYWNIWWFDNLSHFLGGFAGGLAAVWFLFDSGIFYKRSPVIFESILWALVAVLIVGIAWEIFEYTNGLTQSTENYVLDTIHDLIADLTGASLAGIIGAREIFRLRKFQELDQSTLQSQ